MSAVTDQQPAGDVPASNNAPGPSLIPSPNSLPTTLIRTYNIRSIKTDIMVQLFADRIFLTVTQLSGKIGTLLSVSVEDSVIDFSRTYNISTLLGRRDDATLEVMARQVAERIASLGGNKPGMSGGGGAGGGVVCPPILLGVALKKDVAGDAAIFRAIVDLLLQTYREAVAVAAST